MALQNNKRKGSIMRRIDNDKRKEEFIDCVSEMASRHFTYQKFLRGVYERNSWTKKEIKEWSINLLDIINKQIDVMNISDKVIWGIEIDETEKELRQVLDTLICLTMKGK